MRVLPSGVGTGLDLPFLRTQHRYTGIDLKHAILHRAAPRAAPLVRLISAVFRRMRSADRFSTAVSTMSSCT